MSSSNYNRLLEINLISWIIQNCSVSSWSTSQTTKFINNSGAERIWRLIIFRMLDFTFHEMKKLGKFM